MIEVIVDDELVWLNRKLIAELFDKNKILNTDLEVKMNNKIITKINVKDNLIGVMRINNKDYISLMNENMDNLKEELY